ncbi:MAG: hypothetical protein K0S41_2066 [Anaerocolumna sp.]|jgi:hypothetical protein|nr:hypothetical protein [Anaerocolumna sp.]
MLYALKDCANLRIDSATTSKTVLYVNYAKTSSLEFTSDSVFAMNKNVKAVRFDSNREGQFTTTMEVFPMEVIPLLFGTNFSSATVPFAKREILKVTSGSATLVGTPKVGTLQVYKVKEDDKITHIAEQTVGTTTSENKYSIAGQTLTFNTTTTFATDGYVVCYYFVDTAAKKFVVDNISFPGGYVIYGDTNLRGTDQGDDFVQFKLHNVKPQSNASLTMDVDNIATLQIVWDVMGDSEGNMMTWSAIE